MDTIRLSCPDCRSVLLKAEGCFTCKTCGRNYPIIEGIPSFVEANLFYKDRIFEPHIYDNSLISKFIFFASPSLRFMRKYLTKKGKILDLGCGGGNAIYTSLGTVAGVDFSLPSLKKAKSIYDTVAQADVLKLPFENESFDYVISHDLIGHISMGDKKGIISEIFRVLKKGGLTLHYIETAGNNPIERLARRFPAFYQKYFIEQDGHYGLEPPTKVTERFIKAGFIPVAKKKHASTFLRFPKEYLKRFNNEYADKSFILFITAKISSFVSKIRILEKITEFTVLIINSVLEKFTAFDDSSGIYVCYKK